MGLGKGLRVLENATGSELLRDPDYGDTIYGLRFTPDGGLIASSFDGQLRRYGPDLKLMVKRAAPDGKQPSRVAIDRSGQRVAVGYNDRTSVSVLDSHTLAPLARAQTVDLTAGNLFAVSWSRDGETLVAGGTANIKAFQGERRQMIRQFDANGRQYGADTIVSDNTVMDTQPCGASFAFATAEPSFGLFSPKADVTVLQAPRSADMRQKLGTALEVSTDGSAVRFGLNLGNRKPVLFDLAAATAVNSPNLPRGFLPAQVDGLPVRIGKTPLRRSSATPNIALKAHEISRALAVRPDNSGFVLGSTWYVRTYDAEGKERWNCAAPVEARGVVFAPDGEILVVAYADGTIRWLRWSDGAELLSLFIEPQSRKWVAWTPSGYYMASAGGEDLIGWQVNRGWEQEADWFTASQFRAQYNRPDIVRLVLKTRDEAEAVREANASSDRTVPVKPVSAALPPVVAISSPAGGSHFSGNSVDIAYSLRSPSGLPIDRLEAFADGQKVPLTGFEGTNSPEAQGKAFATLPPKDTELSLVAYSGDLMSAPVKVSLVYDGPKTPDLLKPKLYALLVGVTGYDNPDYNNIHFSAHDADDLAKALMAQKGGLYADVEVKVIDDRTRPEVDPTRSNVENGLYWLQHAATNRDLAVVFLSGHGFLDAKQKFWFLTREADIARLRTTAISNDDLLDLMASIPGKKVLFVDACHSGAAMTVGYKATETTPDMNKFVNDFSTMGSGIVVFAASTGTELAKEDEKWDKHGAFAKALIEAIGEGKASIDPSGRITTDMLDLYVEDHVKAMTDGRQHPVMNRPVLVPDFPIAVARAYSIP